jgi:hypothetical protein
MRACLNITPIYFQGFYFKDCITHAQGTAIIHRYALVTRHNVALTKVVTLGSCSVGNGKIGYKFFRASK